jgi:hypothetical protein
MASYASPPEPQVEPARWLCGRTEGMDISLILFVRRVVRADILPDDR